VLLIVVVCDLKKKKEKMVSSSLKTITNKKSMLSLPLIKILSLSSDFHEVFVTEVICILLLNGKIMLINARQKNHWHKR
jgi:hypothetical protein